MQIVRYHHIPWEDRMNVDNWPSRAGTYYNNPETELCIRLIDYPFGSVEPRHVHAGTHATTVLKNHAIVDGLTLGPLDVVIGPSNEPHGPLEYPEGCNLLSAFQGSFYHSEVETLSSEKQYRLVQQESIAWTELDGGGEAKTLVDHGAGRLLVEAMRFPAGAQHKSAFLAALLVDGEVSVEGEPLGIWDFIYADEGDPRADIVCASDATLLTLTMRDTTA
ncbi:MAG: hypothetical protein GKS02_04955 [Alphaproteobacteria bacterium]|nr:hypothetical protein [Alphaproteobacteria bacterium]